MVADILNTFPSFTYNFVMKELTFKQFLLWHMQALRIKYNIDVNLAVNTEDELKKIDEDFKWNEELKRWE